MNKYFIFILCATGFAFSCKKEQAVLNQRQQEPIPAEAFLVQPQSVSETVEVAGSLIPMEETKIQAEVSGRVVHLNVKEGGTVSKGVILVKLFDGDLQTQLKKLQVQLQIAEKTLERQEELLKINGISQQDYDLIGLNVENLKIDMQAVKINISKTEIRAPYTGQLGLRNISLGSFISPSDIITTIREVDQLKLEFAIPERYAQSVEKGYQVSFKVDGNDVAYKAAVIATENNIDISTRTLKVRALVKAQGTGLIPGVFAHVNLQLGKNSKALMIPSQAIIPQARNKQVIVYKNDSIQFKVIETGVRDSAYVEITSGLHEGDTVIISGLMAIRPTSKIKLTGVKKYSIARD